MRTCKKQLTRGMAELVVALMLVGSAGTIAVAEKVRGTATCTTGSYARTINGKAHTCTSKCTTPVTETTCNPNCSSTVYNEVSYGGCTENAASRPPRTHLGTVPPANMLEVDRGPGGGGRPGATGQPVRPAAPAQRLQ